MNLNKINIKECLDITNYIIDNNKRLQSLGKKTTAIEIIGDTGLGKTSAILQLAEKRKMKCIKINLSQLEEVGDLLGFPLTEYELKNKETQEIIWVAKDLLEMYIKTNIYIPTNQHRMSYAIPKWVPREETEEGYILLLDDYSRALPLFIQATMELIDRQEFISWKLPKNCTICLTSNLDNGEYAVSSLDFAQKSRFVSFELEFDIKLWAEWAEKEEIDSRVINFALLYPEIFNKQGDNQASNPRSYTTFANAISGFKDFSNTKTLAAILNISKGCFIDENNIIGNKFILFLSNKYDKLPSPQEMLLESWNSMQKILENCIYEKENYRADIASTLTIRFLNYTQIYFKQPKAKTEVVVNRLLEFVQHDKILLTEDLIFYLIKQLVKQYPERTNKLMINKIIANKIL